MRIGIIGSNGQLGTDLVKTCKDAGHSPVHLNLPEFNVVERKTVVDTISGAGVDLVINTAAFHRVDECEENPIETFSVNAGGAKNVADGCVAAGIPVAFISTDYIFDGKKGFPYREDDPPHPLNTYGISKLAGELVTETVTDRHFIFRVSGLYGLNTSMVKGTNFVETMLKLAKRGNPIQVVDDQILTPTFTGELAQKLIKVIEGDRFGIYHLTNCGQCSWFEFAKAVIELSGIDAKIKPQTTIQSKRKARRPANSVLDNAHLRAVGIEEMSHWREALAQYLKLERAIPLD